MKKVGRSNKRKKKGINKTYDTAQQNTVVWCMKYTSDRDTETDKNRGTYSEHDHKVKLGLGVQRGRG